jgi:hypothetical protein
MPRRFALWFSFYAHSLLAPAVLIRNDHKMKNPNCVGIYTIRKNLAEREGLPAVSLFNPE